MHWNLIIATWNRSILLGQTLESVLTLQSPEDVTWDVTVADNHSTDDTAIVVQSFQSRFNGRLHYLYEAQQGKSYALNAALAQTHGDWVLFLDDDVRVAPDLLITYASAARKYPKAGCLAGGIIPLTSHALTRNQKWLLREYPVLSGQWTVAADQPMTPQSTGWGANMAICRSCLPPHGFSTDRGMFAGRRVSGEDVAMLIDILQAGHPGWLLTGADVWHHTPSNALRLHAIARTQRGIGRQWRLERGAPTPGRWGVPWWAWKEYARRWLLAALAWRPWLTRRYCDRILALNQYHGYLRG